MKDEVAGDKVLAFVGLRAKLYAYKTRKQEDRKCKGLKRSVIKQSITFADYERCLFTK